MANGNSGGDAADESKREREKLEDEIKKGIASVLDELVSVNSIFTMAVFLGLSFATPNQQGLESRPECSADTNMAKRLVMYEVASFACFLLSNMVARSLKVYVHIFEIRKRNEKKNEQTYIDWNKGIMFLLSFMSSLAGIGLLVASMVCVVEIKLGKLHCGSPYALTAVISLLALVVVAGALYLFRMLQANVFFFVSRTWPHRKNAGYANNGNSQGA